MLAVRQSFGKIVHREVAADALGVTVKTARGKMGVLNVHLPPKATLLETGQRTASWADLQSMKHHSRIFMVDLNETFVRAEVGRNEWSTLQHKTARGAMLLQWLSEQEMQPPSQDISTPTYHPYNPYNHLHQPRRLDYIFFAGILEGSTGRVHQIRHLASSDHDAVTACMHITLRPAQRVPPTTMHGAKQLKGEEAVKQALEQSKSWRGDRLRDLKRAALTITEAKKNPFRYVESRDIKQLRAAAMRQRHTPKARALWKEVWKRKKEHKEQWQRELLQEVLRNNWHALHAVERSRKPTMWAGKLTEEEGWQKRMRAHFESIFKKQDGEAVRDQVRKVWRRLERRCKEQPWEPFSAEELTKVMSKWKGGKSTGPDGVPFEALKALNQDDHWQHAILQEFNDALYEGKLPPDIIRNPWRS